MRKIFLFLILATLALTMTGCAKKVFKEWVPETGSRADATVTLSLFWNPNTEIPETDKGQALWTASSRCKAWGYSGAEPFGTIQTKCTNKYFNGFEWVCNQMTASAVYQCTNNTTPTAPKTDPSKKEFS